MRGRMTVFQFLVILTVKVYSTAAPPTPSAHPLRILYMKVGGGIQVGEGTACMFQIDAALSVT